MHAVFDLSFLMQCFLQVWQGLWTALFTILLAVFDLSFLMKYISRFTEEIFSGLITVIFILEAVLNILKVVASAPDITLLYHGCN